MAITYHAGRRIQGLADDRSLTTQAVYTSTYGQSTYNKLNGTPQAYIGQKCGVELVSTANDGKKIKIGKWKLAREGTLSGLAYMKVEDSSGTVKATSTGVSVSSLILRTSGYAYVTFTLTEAVALYNGDRVYIEYTTADGSGSFLAVGEFYNGSTTIPTGFEFTAYNVADANGNNATGTWTDTGYPTLLTPDAIFDDQPVTDENQITNVQSGSRFEETDTRKIYYLSPPTSPDYNYPMDSALTSEVASYVFVTGGELKHVVQRGTSRVGYQDLGANLSSNWVFTMKVRIPARSGTSSNQTAYYLLSSSTTNQDSDQPSPTGNAIGITINLRSNGSAEDGSTSLNVGNTYAYNLAQDGNSYRFIPVNTEITKWLKMIKNGNTITYTIHDSVDDMYNSVLTSGSDTGSITNATAGAFSNLRYFKVHNVVGQSTTVETMYVDDVKIYDGVTSMPNPNSTWTEEV